MISHRHHVRMWHLRDISRCLLYRRSLGEIRASLGDLEIEDCQLAATQFMELCQASLFKPFIFQAAPHLRPSASQKWSKARPGYFWPGIGRPDASCRLSAA